MARCGSRRLHAARGTACLLVVVSALAASPTRAVETIVSFDDAGRLQRLTAQQRDELRLWPGRFPDFQEARIWRDEAGVERLQVVWREGSRWLQERFELAPAEAESLRAAVRNWLAMPALERPSAGMRTLLLSSTTLTGLGFFSWGIPRAAQTDGKTAVAIGMLSAGFSFALPYLATRKERVTPGMAQLGIAGLTRGIGYGALLHRAWAGPRGDSDGGIEAGVIGSLAGGTAGYLWARGARLDAGRAHLIEAGSDLGTLAAVEAALAFGLPAEGEEEDRSLEYASVLGGAAVGIAGAARRGADSRPTWGDAEILRTTSILAQGVMLTAWDLGTENRPTIAAAALTGSIAGAWLGDRLTDRPRFRASQAILLDLCTVAGGALALGGVYLSETDANSYDHEAYTVGATLGALAGYGLAYRAFVDDATGGEETSGSVREEAPHLSIMPALRATGSDGVPAVGLACGLRF